MTPLRPSIVEADTIGVPSLQVFDRADSAAAAASPRDVAFALLLAIARVELLPEDQQIVEQLLGRPLDWPYLLTMAELHGLEPLLLHHVSTVAPVAVPAAVIRALQRNCKVIALRNLVLSSKLCEISAHLTSRHIEHIAYKGPLLAEIYGGNGALRAYRDLDLLTSQSELGSLRDAIREIGFVDRYGLSETQQAASFRFGFEHSFTSNSGIELDVHWRVTQEFKSYALDMDGVWSRKTVSRLMNQDIPALSPEDLLVVLCLHAGNHAWTYLSHLCDLAQLFRTHRSFAWEIVKSHLGDSHTQRVVCVSLHLLEKHWNVELPAEIKVFIVSDAHVERLVHRIETEIWPAEKSALTTSSMHWLLNRSTGEEWRDRLRLLVGSIFVPAIEDFAMVQLSPALSPLYAALRMLRLAWRAISCSFYRRTHGEGSPRMAFENGFHGEE